MLSVAIYGIALSALWYWIYIIVRKDFSSRALKQWITVIVPQGILIALALTLLGVL